MRKLCAPRVLSSYFNNSTSRGDHCKCRQLLDFLAPDRAPPHLLKMILGPLLQPRGLDLLVFALVSRGCPLPCARQQRPDC